MNSDLFRDFENLVTDVKAAIDSELHRGIRYVTETSSGIELPTTVPPVELHPEAPVSPWAALAREARSEETGEQALHKIRADLGDCRRCGLCEQRQNIVFGVGDPQADLVIVGEGPGHDEDIQGEPFVGAAGQMLNRMLSNVLQLERHQVYIANVIKCRPPGNRNPLPDEVAACRPFLERQILSIQPKLLLILGTVALKSLLGTEAGIMRLRGTWLEWSGIPVLPTFHPAYLLRNPADKKKTFEDLKVLRTRYDEMGGRR